MARGGGPGQKPPRCERPQRRRLFFARQMTTLQSPRKTGRQAQATPSNLLARTDRATLCIIGVASLVLLVLLSRMALDILVLMIAAGVLFLFERTVGDWLLDAL